MTFCMLSCSGKSDNAQTGISEHRDGERVTEAAVPIEKGKLEVEDAMPLTVRPTGDPEKDWIFVEQAVDAWLYFNLSDFKSHELLIRSTDYDSIHDIYTHHLRFRSMNEQGGMVIADRDFEVDLNRKGSNGNPFFVKEVR